MKHTLLLNQDMQPLSVFPLSTIHFHTAIKLIAIDRVSVLDEYEDWVVRSPSIEMNVPAVMSLRDQVRFSRQVKFSRPNVFLRDMFTCQFCGNKFPPQVLTFDHVVPKFHGGKTKWTNIVTSCEKCNLKKSHRTDMRPKTEPRQPNYHEMVAKARSLPIQIRHESWIQYLNWSPDLIVRSYQKGP